MALARQLLKVIEWKDDTQDTMAYRHPMRDRDEIMKGCQLIVKESQVAILVSEGRLADVFTPGRYKLETGNIPIITKLMGWKYGFESPLKCEVYFINTKQFINQKWGTSNPVMMRDQDFGMVQFRGFGQFTFRISEPDLFLRDILGTGASYKVRDIVDQLRRTIVSGITEAVAASNVPALDLAMKYTAIGQIAYGIVKPKLISMGIDLANLDIENLSLTEESMATLTKRTNMNIIGNAREYSQFAAADAMTEMAKNAHKAQGINPSTMIMGANLGNMMTDVMRNNNAASNEPQEPCDKCGVMNKASAKFCYNCGDTMLDTKVQVQNTPCPKCKALNPQGAKFCLECGNSMAGNVCGKCGTALTPKARFCPTCGTKAK